MIAERSDDEDDQRLDDDTEKADGHDYPLGDLCEKVLFDHLPEEDPAQRDDGDDDDRRPDSETLYISFLFHDSIELECLAWNCPVRV